jgi:hypothetical protein
MQALDHLLDRRFFAFDMRVNPAVGAIADPAGQAELGRLVAQLGTEEHTLHSPGHADVPGDRAHGAFATCV